mgnify:CR=1 FL=1
MPLTVRLEDQQTPRNHSPDRHTDPLTDIIYDHTDAVTNSPNITSASPCFFTMDSPLEVYVVPIILTVLTLITLALVLSVRGKPKHKSKEVEALLKDQVESSEPAGTVYLSDVSC